MCRGRFIEKYNINEAVELLLQRIDICSTENILSESHEDAFVSALYTIYFYHLFNKDTMPTEISTVSRMIVENSEQEFTLNDLSQHTYISKYYLIKKFKESVGLTPHYFHIQARIRKAQRLLHGGVKIAETASDTGFYDQSHFNKYFNQIVGITPHEYIRSIEELD